VFAYFEVEEGLANFRLLRRGVQRLGMVDCVLECLVYAASVVFNP